MGQIRFGYFLTPAAAEAGTLLRTARTLDRLGFDLVGIQDHPYQRRFLDSWTLLTAVAVSTQHLTVFPDVACLPLRPPAVLAKSAASLDVLTGGRVEMGVGAGGFWDAIAAFGGPRRAAGEAVRALAEAIEVMRLMWSAERSVRFDGEFYSLGGVHPGPRPAHPIGIWLGAYKPRMLWLIGEHADGWVPSLGFAGPEGLAEATATLDAAAEKAGRDPASIRRVLNVGADVPVDELPDLLIRIATELRFDSFVFDGPADEAALTHLAREVFPRVRNAV
ncbi:LLM class flavin-dependent oxidoreductase [Rhodococcus chondri]|uniref:LLM class flavin-dependent oxidoreductase n=1 Tax=Rhodococcus chondri TaxID=3065941 RepID=A0ABU7JLN6_9NOCA|nr:LLM class flavin-dependent oxidoreductase [Rhodococcus sp. CC-R104]MEE2030956.1 LLM class flavin-dependent oxidoreductase [Rhodococcus sp. CC-R104]